MTKNKNTLPVLALKDIVLFPGTTAPLFIGRKESLTALSEAKNIGSGDAILLTTQKDQKNTDKLKNSQLFKVGTIGRIIQTVKLPNGNYKLIVEVEQRVKLTPKENKEFFLAEYSLLPDKPIKNLDDLDEIIIDIMAKFNDYVAINRKVNPDVLASVSDQRNPAYVTNIISSHLTSGLDKKQKILEETNVEKRCKMLSQIIDEEIALVEAEQDLQMQVKKQIEKTQKDYFLNEQMKVIHKELHGGDEKAEMSEFEKKIKSLKLSKEGREKAEAELRKLRSMNPMSSEFSVVRNYLEMLLAMPWGKQDKGKIDIKNAKKVLDRDHYGLDKVKDRIVEYLAVLQRSKNLKSPILCMVGPPGVGKTSLVKSIAEAVERKYAKIALGGVHDESEIRGHRRTYLGSMPGKIISSIKKSKTDNPVILLDEIDKMSHDFRGDPASALLEVLDPEQNKFFVDHYLEVEYDLSKIMFIATANSYKLPRPLLDRLEVIDISGYIEDEKLQIAKKHLIPSQLKIHNMKQAELKIPDETILHLIRYYTMESGVRGLERQIGALARKVLTKILKDDKTKSITVKPKDVEEYLGVKKYKFGLADEHDQIGVCTGLAYTEVGGDLLSIEATTIPGDGKIKATGKLGDVMKESTEAAFSVVQSKAAELGIDTKALKEQNIHLHVPEGATPKDGPSAGIAIFSTLTSLLTKTPVKRTVAMTGEITLRGNVLPIGGLKEKLLAASRGGIKTVVIPKENERNLKDIPKSVLDLLEIKPISHIDELLDIAFTKKPSKNAPKKQK